MKTYAGWGATGETLDQYPQVGDVVDQEMADYFVNVLPPASMSGLLVQIGEPANHVGERPTYATLRRNHAGQWVYAGECFRGESAPPPVPKRSMSDFAIDILRATHDGDDLAPQDLALVEAGVNGHLNALGQAAMVALHANATKPEGYTSPCLFDIPQIDHRQ